MDLLKYFKKDKLQITIAWIIYFFVNLVFCIRYNPISEIKPLYLILSYPLIVLGIYKLTTYKNFQRKNIFFIGIALAILALSIFFIFYIDKYSLQVDRWSALAFWSENLKNGIFPYGSSTHLGSGASPYPVWQIFYFPFYLMGDTAYGQIFCLIIFFAFLFINRQRLNIGGFILLLAISPAFWWEMAVRSDLLTNMLLVYVFLSSIFYYNLWNKNIYWLGLFVGLFLCTKMFVAIPLFLYFFPKFLSLDLKRKFIFTLIVLVGFIGPFLPFLFGENSILNHPEYNPILVQTRQGNIWIFIIEFVLILFVSLKWKTMKDCFFYSGLFLFLLIFSVGVEIFLSNNLEYVFFGNEFDVSYFNVSIPFFLFCITENLFPESVKS